MQQVAAAECGRCGIVFARFIAARVPAVDDGPAAHERPAPGGQAGADSAAAGEARRELIARAVAIPAALAGAAVIVKAAPGVRILTVWVHEAGHATAAWLCGFMAVPGPWITVVSPERSPALSVLLGGALVAGAYQAWRHGRWFWVASAIVTFALQLVCTLRLYEDQAQAVVTFGGDAGSFVLGAVLMASVYARPDHPVRANHLRWVLVVLGALAFMDARHTWWGGVDSIPFGEDDRGLSDASKLAEYHNWTVDLLIERHRTVATLCAGLLGVAYVVGLVTASDGSGSDEASGG